MNVSSGLQNKINKGVKDIINGKENGEYVFEPKFEAAQSGTSIINDNDVVMLTSNNYLGMATDADVENAMQEAIDKYGSGTCGARLHNGTTDLHVQLEKQCAKFFNTEAAVILSSGFMANLAAISSIADDSTLIITDQFNHESIDDGIKLSGANIRIFEHNNMDKLEYILSKNDNYDKKLIIVEGVYSMGGDLCPLDKVNELAKKYNASILLDEAHSFGFIGNHGRGVAELFGVEKDIHMRMATFSKSTATVGGCIATDKKTAEYIKHHANQYIFNASLPPSIVAGTIESLKKIQTESWRKDRLWKNTFRFRKGLLKIGLNVMESTSPIVPIFVGDDNLNMKITKELLESGVYIATAVYPAVPHNSSRLRATITASLTNSEIDYSLSIIEKVFNENGLI